MGKVPFELKQSILQRLCCANSFLHPHHALQYTDPVPHETDSYAQLFAHNQVSKNIYIQGKNYFMPKMS